MLDAGEHALGRSQVIALEALDPGRGEQPPEQHVLAGAFDTAAPTLVAGDVDHRRKGPVDPRAGRFERRRRRGPARKVGLEAGDFGERHGEDRAMAVDDVGGEHQRDLETGLLDRCGLQDPRHPCAIAIEHAGELPLPRFLDLARKARIVLRRIERQRDPAAPGRSHHAELPGFFLQRHARNEIVSECWNPELVRCLDERSDGAC